MSTTLASLSAFIAAILTAGIASFRARRRGPDFPPSPALPIASAARARTMTDASSNPSSRMVCVSARPSSASTV